MIKALSQSPQLKGKTIKLIYGFGSYFGGNFREDSDIDIAFFEEGASLSPEDFWELQNHLSNLLKRDVDLIDLNKAPIVLKFQIVSEGQNIFCSSENAKAVFETYIYSAYYHFQEERREILKDVLERKSVYGR